MTEKIDLNHLDLTNLNFNALVMQFQISMIIVFLKMGIVLISIMGIVWCLVMYDGIYRWLPILGIISLSIILFISLL